MAVFKLLWAMIFICSFYFIAEMTPTEGACTSSFDYKDAMNKAILFLEGQRSGKLPPNQRVKWRGDSALSDGSYENVNLAGGYYDAGDNVKFGWPMAFSVSLMSLAAIEYEQKLSSSGHLNDLRSAIAWGANFIMKSHPSPDVFYTQVGDGKDDHDCWERPEDMDTKRTLYKVSSSSPGTEPAAEGAAALAATSIVFKSVNPKYSTVMLRVAKSLFKLADGHRASYSQSCPFYCSYSGYQDELLWAATWLYKATNDNYYLNYIINNQGWSQSTTEFGWDNKNAGFQALLAKEYFSGHKNLQKFKDQMETYVCSVMPGSGSTQVKTTNGGLIFVRDAANLQYSSIASMFLNFYAKVMDSNRIGSIQCNSRKYTSKEISAFAKSQVDYILGCNPMRMSYMVGFGTKYPTQIHHRGASIPSKSAHPAKVSCKEGFSSYFNVNTPNPNVHTGAIVGGPDQNDQYKDTRLDSNHAEPTTYINAAFIGSVAAIL